MWFFPGVKWTMRDANHPLTQRLRISGAVPLLSLYAFTAKTEIALSLPLFIITVLLRLWVFENRVLRRIFGPKRDEVTGEWRRLHKKELYALYSSPNIIRVIKSRRLRWSGRVARMGETRDAYRALVGKPEVRRPRGRPGRRWEDTIKMDLLEVGWGGGMDWIDLAQVAGCCEYGDEPSDSIKCGEFLE
jgi:hypothetical protein